ncbi:hypothetical protein MPSEU_000909000 [Mayamaea pseudoterrestris]|nr:hypothetical protein MPSEU_000909000 [Mayamaea pseudoterrestris]
MILSNDGNDSIWTIATTPLLCKSKTKKESAWRLWMGSSSSESIKLFRVEEISLETKAADLNASAMRLQCTHEFIGKQQQANRKQKEATDKDASSSSVAISFGCSSISIVRNYIGQDDDAGDYLIMALDLAGHVRMWSLPEDWDDNHDAAVAERDDKTPFKPCQVKAVYEFDVDDATGTCAILFPPRISGQPGDVFAAITCLDGTIAMVATGIVTPNYHKEPTSTGTIIDSYGSRGSALAMSLCWHPKQQHLLCTGRKDGSIDLLTQSRKNQHRLQRHTAPVRAVAFTDDGHLLISASDAGTILIWDVTRPAPVLVHHVMQAHKSWILNIATLPDSRRFVTCGADRKIHVWSVGQMHQAVHTFQADAEIWALARGPVQNSPRLVTGSENGHLQVYSLEK